MAKRGRGRGQRLKLIFKELRALGVLKEEDLEQSGETSGVGTLDLDAVAARDQKGEMSSPVKALEMTTPGIDGAQADCSNGPEPVASQPEIERVTSGVGALDIGAVAAQAKEEGMSSAARALDVATPGIDAAQPGCSNENVASWPEIQQKKPGNVKLKGWFRCPNGECPLKIGNEANYWSSFNSWKNAWQKCRGCRTIVYPFKQLPIEKVERTEEDTERALHDEMLCGKFQLLGVPCRKMQQRVELPEDSTHTVGKKMSQRVEDQVQNLIQRLKREPFAPKDNN